MNLAQQANGSECIARVELCAAVPSRLQCCVPELQDHVQRSCRYQEPPWDTNETAQETIYQHRNKLRSRDREPRTEAGAEPGWSSSALHTRMPFLSPKVTNSYIQGPTDTPLLDKTMGQCLEETVERFPDREAVVFCWDGVRKTFAQLKEEVDQAAAGLLALGLRKGDRLGMWGPNKYEWVLMQFATAQAGIILVGCKALVFPTQFKTQKYYDILKQSCPELEKSSPGGIKSKRLPDLSIVIMCDSKLPGTFHMHEVMQAGDSSHVKQLRAVQQSLSCNEPINIQFTSGTTGSPKGATLSHRNIVNNAYLVGLRLGITDQESRCGLPAPLYHCLASVGGCMVMALHGTSCIFPSPSFEGKAALEAVSREKCSFILGTPTMYIDMLSQPDFDSYDLSTLRGGIIAGSPVPPEIMKTIMTKMHMPELVVAYGTTENSPVTFMGFPNDSIDRKTETVGYIFPHTEAKIEDPETGKSVPLNTPGELQIRGYCVMLGYWNDPAKTSEVITAERWYKTGDIGSLDEHGYCKIVGRCKDMIIRGGENIYPAELEQFLHTHPKVEEVQVVGVKDSRMGEEICACIRLRAGQDCTEEEIKAFCKGKISHFKIPHYVVFVRQYPLTVSGKIQKYMLREQMEKHLRL
ncbi:acyl-CoA synthetase family member 2, mitochondrial isoform X2 [Cyanistes caeruleus]|uniref:acyl-CoA synthetase family member 2, mitochondrial isoform X2 n=1 Tax=Cyanistes caeruleus TaxID=156563 RepID=UPI000CDA6C57|nr:acyl-CoA synthetase family member 2, mitochondrial isoform X2 [Cyanistes caeruleus]